MLVAQREWNVILAPHQRLIEIDPDMRNVLLAAAAHPHVHADWQSFAMVDGSYTAAADLYLGDTSSQVLEYLVRPRPCVFLNSQRVAWRATDDHGFWECGEVVDHFGRLAEALGRAAALHERFRAIQQQLTHAALGEFGGDAPQRCAQEILALAA